MMLVSFKCKFSNLLILSNYSLEIALVIQKMSGYSKTWLQILKCVFKTMKRYGISLFPSECIHLTELFKLRGNVLLVSRPALLFILELMMS